MSSKPLSGTPGAANMRYETRSVDARTLRTAVKLTRKGMRKNRDFMKLLSLDHVLKDVS